ncbi:MAG: hypothetical protein AAGI89_13935 [Pseudomonadota bacterium]
MDTSYRKRAGLIASLGLAIPVATTITYMMTLGGPQRAGYGPGYEGFAAYLTERWSDIVTVWTVESVGFVLCAIAALGLAASQTKGRAAWNAIALGSLGGFVSTAMGISLFKGFGTAGEDHAQLAFTVVNSSFFFFFAGKALTGAGVAGLAVDLFKDGNPLSKLFALIAGLAGVAALAVNIAAAATGTALVMPGGLVGTVATALGVPVAFLVTRSAATSGEEAT